MAKETYLFGYAGKRKTFNQMMATNTYSRIHPEVRRRLEAMLEDCPYDLGFGNGWRSTKDQEWSNDNSAGTTAGNSYHESVTPEGYCLAFDLLNYNPAIKWANENCHKYGLYTGIDWRKSEKWHCQPKEIPDSRRYYNPNVHTLDVWNLPGDAPVITSVWPNPRLTGSRSIRPGARGFYVKQVQRNLKEFANTSGRKEFDPGPIDGIYGPKSVAAMKEWQQELTDAGFSPGAVDGWYGPNTYTKSTAYYEHKGWYRAAS